MMDILIPLELRDVKKTDKLVSWIFNNTYTGYFTGTVY